MTTCEPSENLQYFLKLQKQRSKKRMSLFKEKQTFRPFYFQIFISSSFLVCFEQFKKLWKHHLKLFKKNIQVQRQQSDLQRS
jgi:hypothetical protein